MRRKLGNPVGITFAALVLLIAFFFARGSFRPQKHIVLPPENAPHETEGGQQDQESIDRIVISPETVQTALGMLHRPEDCFYTLRCVRSWSGGSSTTHSRVSVSGGLLRVDAEQPNGSLRHLLRSGGTDYIWYDAERHYLKMPSLFSSDTEQGLLTYEDVLRLDPERIALADYRLLNGTRCIFTETVPDDAGCVDRFWVSTDSGLPAAAQRCIDGNEVYEVTVEELSCAVPDASLFTLPDGTLLSSDATGAEEDRGQ